MNIDNELIAEATRLTGVKEKTALVRMALESLIRGESARRLAKLGGTMPDFEPAPRRRAAGGSSEI